MCGEAKGVRFRRLHLTTKAMSTLRLLTHNMWLSNNAFKGERPDKLERIDLLFSALDNSYDIVTFQEVFRFGNTTLWYHDNSPHDKMTSKSKENGYFILLHPYLQNR
jgi:hypothetical protein